EAWRQLERHLARGLLDEMAAQALPNRRPEELQRLRELQGRLSALDQQLAAHLDAKDALGAGRPRFEGLTRQRKEIQARLPELDTKWATDEVWSLAQIQEQLPADAALLAWVDLPTVPRAADPRGDHWACVVRHQGPPAWLRLPGAGAEAAWTGDDDTLRLRL